MISILQCRLFRIGSKWTVNHLKLITLIDTLKKKLILGTLVIVFNLLFHYIYTINGKRLIV